MPAEPTKEVAPIKPVEENKEIAQSTTPPKKPEDSKDDKMIEKKSETDLLAKKDKIEDLVSIASSDEQRKSEQTQIKPDDKVKDQDGQVEKKDKDEKPDISDNQKNSASISNSTNMPTSNMATAKHEASVPANKNQTTPEKNNELAMTDRKIEPANEALKPGNDEDNAQIPRFATEPSKQTSDSRYVEAESGADLEVQPQADHDSDVLDDSPAINHAYGTDVKQKDHGMNKRKKKSSKGKKKPSETEKKTDLSKLMNKYNHEKNIEEQNRQDEEDDIEEDYHFADDDSIGPEVCIMILREIKVPTILTRQRTEEFSREPENNDLTDLIDDGHNDDDHSMVGSFGLKPPLDSHQESRSQDMSRSYKMHSKSVASNSVTDFEVFCISKEEKHAYLVSRDAILYRVPLSILVSTRNYTSYIVAQLFLNGAPEDILHLGTEVAICSETDICLVSTSDWREVLHHQSPGREQVVHSYRMLGRRLWGRSGTGGSVLAWWTHQTGFWMFSQTAEGWQVVGRESLAAKGKILPGITGDSRAYAAVSFERGNIILCLCDDHQYVFMKPFTMKSKSDKLVKGSIKTVGQAFSQYVPLDLLTLISVTSPNAPSIRGLSIINEGFALLQWSKLTGTTVDMYMLRSSKATFYSSTALHNLISPQPAQEPQIKPARQYINDGRRTFWTDVANPKATSQHRLIQTTPQLPSICLVKPDRLSSIVPDQLWFMADNLLVCLDTGNMKPFIRKTVDLRTSEGYNQGWRYSIGKTCLMHASEGSLAKIIRL